MNLCCAFVCVLLLTVNEVDSRPENLSQQVGSISTKHVRFKVDEDELREAVRELNKRLPTLESIFSGVTRPDAKKELKQRFDSFKVNISMDFQNIYHEDLEVCLGINASPGDIAPCSGNPTSYIEEKFSPLYKRIEEFKVECLSYLIKDLKKVNYRPEKLSNPEGRITNREVKDKLDEIQFEMLLRILNLDTKYMSVNHTLKDEVRRRIDRFGKGIGQVVRSIYDTAKSLCIWSDIFPGNNFPCVCNPMMFITKEDAYLKRKVDTFEKGILHYLGKENGLKEEDWSPEEILNQEGINTTQHAQMKINADLAHLQLWLFNLEFELLESVNPDFRVEFERKFDSFRDKIKELDEAISQEDVKFCQGSDTSHEAACYRSPKKFLKEKFTPLYKRIKKFGMECCSLLIYDSVRRHIC